MTFYLYDHSFSKEEENLACDDALLLYVNENPTLNILRFWESPSYYVVLGLSNKEHTEANVKHCKDDTIKICRRCSGGGTVLQGPGCMNYAFILPISEHPIQTISETNTFVMSLKKGALPNYFKFRSQRLYRLSH